MRRFKNIIRSPKQKSLLSGVNAPKNFVVEPFSVKNQCIDAEALHSRSVEETKTVTLNLHESQAAGRQSGMVEDELLSKSTLNKVQQLFTRQSILDEELCGPTPRDILEELPKEIEELVIPSEEANESKDANVLQMSLHSRSESCEKPNPQQPLSHHEIEEDIVRNQRLSSIEVPIEARQGSAALYGQTKRL